ncbi:sugar ABC transporter ATP-binding protein [Streptomyces sp. NPDC021098]|uniref:sugar ABC transporter ATP-binding protein n=1 Tax=unclassified Streptomyces TaxID=2593676 RepID=UPI0037A598FC
MSPIVMPDQPTPATPALQLRGVTKRYGGTTALDDVSMTVNRHEVIGLIGENGAGKSTLLKILAGVHQPDAGEIVLRDRPTVLRSGAHAATLGIGVVHQEQSLLTNWTIAENLHATAPGGRSGLAARLGLVNWRRVNAEAGTVLERVGITTRPDVLVEKLSFAERQMVEIAKAVRVGADGGSEPIVVLDEPTSILENEEVDVLAAEIARIRALGSVIFVSHRLHEVLSFTDRIYVLRAGRIVAERKSSEVEEVELLQLMTGREVAKPKRAERALGEAAPVLRVSGLSRAGEFADVSLTIRPGEIHSLIGTHSSGRESLARCLFGAEQPDGGVIDVHGRRIDSMTVRSAIRSGIAYLPAERKAEAMIPGMSIAENLTLTHGGAVRRGALILTRARTELAERWIKRLDIRPPLPESDIARLSGGNAQKVVLGKWLGADSLSLLILDHPLRGLDPGAIETIKKLIREERDRGTAVLLLADTLEEAIEMADHIVVMRDGRITGTHVLAEGTPSAVELMEEMV